MKSMWRHVANALGNSYTDHVKTFRGRIFDAHRFMLTTGVGLAHDDLRTYCDELYRERLLVPPYDKIYIEWFDPDPNDAARRGFAVLDRQTEQLAREQARERMDRFRSPQTILQPDGTTYERRLTDRDMDVFFDELWNSVDDNAISVDSWYMLGGVIQSSGQVYVQDHSACSVFPVVGTELKHCPLLVYDVFSEGAMQRIKEAGALERFKIEMARDAPTTRAAIACFIALLGTRGIDIEPVYADTRSNRRALKQGRPREVSHHVLHLFGKARHASSGPGQDRHGVRLHWRRGHIRWLGSGKRTFVRPHLVGSPSDGFVSKEYVL